MPLQRSTEDEEAQRPQRHSSPTRGRGTLAARRERGRTLTPSGRGWGPQSRDRSPRWLGLTAYPPPPAQTEHATQAPSTRKISQPLDRRPAGLPGSDTLERAGRQSSKDASHPPQGRPGAPPTRPTGLAVTCIHSQGHTFQKDQSDVLLNKTHSKSERDWLIIFLLVLLVNLTW